MIMTTLDTWWELLHQCLAEDRGPSAVDPAAEATVQHPACPLEPVTVQAAGAVAEASSKKAAARDRASNHNKLVDA